MSQSDKDGQINLLLIINTAIQYKLIIIIITLLATLSTITFLQLQKPRWEASALIKTGQIGPNISFNKSKPTKIESIDKVLVRLKNPAFSEVLFNKLVLKDKQTYELKSLFDSSLKATKVKGTDLISISLRSYSSKEAEKLILASIKELSGQHQQIAKNEILLLDSILKRLKDSLKHYEKTVKDSMDKLSKQKSLSSSELLLTTMYVKETLERISELNDDINFYSLSSAMTYSTQLAFKINSSQAPVWPNKSLFTLIAFFLSLFLVLTACVIYEDLKEK